MREAIAASLVQRGNRAHKDHPATWVLEDGEDGEDGEDHRVAQENEGR